VGLFNNFGSMTKLPASYALVAGILILGATCLASLVGIGIMMSRLQSVEEKLLEMYELRVDERLLRLEMRLDPKAVPKPKPRAVAE
jgi:hypothetical protein